MEGMNLRKLRKEKKLTQAQLASMLNVDQTLVGKWELHKVFPNDKTLIKLCEILECSIDFLLTGKESSWKKDFVNVENYDEIEEEIHRIYKLLDIKSKNKLLNLAYELEANVKNK